MRNAKGRRQRKQPKKKKKKNKLLRSDAAHFFLFFELSKDNAKICRKSKEKEKSLQKQDGHTTQIHEINLLQNRRKLSWKSKI